MTDALTPKKHRQGFFKYQLAWFLGISLLPLLIGSLITIHQTQEEMKQNVLMELQVVADHKVDTIESFFRNAYRALLFQAREFRISEMLKDLELFYAMSGLTSSEFVQSSDWQFLVENFDTEFDQLTASSDLCNLFLISGEGDILFSMARNKDLGTNIFHGPFSSTKFGEACRRAYDEEYPFFSDFEIYAPSGGVATAFWVTPLFNGEGEKKGLLAAQINIDRLNRLMRSGETAAGECYLIGNDLLVRASSRFEGIGYSLTVHAETLQAKIWKEERQITDVILHGNEEHGKALLYQGLYDQEVLGIHHDVEIGQVKMAVIIETPARQAFAIVQHQRELFIYAFCIVALVVTGIAFFAARKVTAPLHRLSTLAQQVALGDLDITDSGNSFRKDEFGDVESSFAKMVSSLQEISTICEDISRGIFMQKATVRGDKDVLARSVNTMIDNFKHVIAQANAVAQGDYSQDISLGSEQDEIGLALDRMTRNLREISEINQRNDWLKTGQAKIAATMGGGKPLNELARDVIGFIAGYLESPVGTFYVEDNWEDAFVLAGTYSFYDPKSSTYDFDFKLVPDSGTKSYLKPGSDPVSSLDLKCISDTGTRLDLKSGADSVSSIDLQSGLNLKSSFKSGEGLIGEAARKKDLIILKALPKEAIHIESSLCRISPRELLVMPLILDNHVKGVLELGTLHPFLPHQIDFLKQISEPIALAIHTAQESRRTRALLDKTQAQAEELEVQQEELRETNDQLTSQEEELRVFNEELSDKTESLEKQKESIEHANRDLEKAREALIQKARDLEISNQYKSEFLANMSHELRTPLNSLLLISKRLTRNKENNLTQKQIESAEIIHNSGNELLVLINDILDLAKIEAGKMDIVFETVEVSLLQENLHALFSDMAETKGLDFTVTINSNLPESIMTDRQRLEQILRNLISNAIKFTEQGSVSVLMSHPEADAAIPLPDLLPEEVILFSIVDTGVGINKDKQRIIFEAFQQEDGTTSRKYGGTGLGLSISKKLTHLLGGELSLTSVEGHGSTFTIFLPLSPDSDLISGESLSKSSVASLSKNSVENLSKSSTERIPENYPETNSQNAAKRLSERVSKSSEGSSMVPSATPQGQIDEARSRLRNFPTISDDRDKISNSDKSILFIEDEISFANLLYETCHEKGFLALHASTGESGIELAKEYLPTAIILDLGLPGMTGMEVLDVLKETPSTRHIPVQIISALEKTMLPLQKGAIGYLTKPINDEQLDHVFQEFNEKRSNRIKELLIVEDCRFIQEVVKALHASKDVHITSCETGQKAVQLISESAFDCVILDLGLPDISGFEVLRQIHSNKPPHGCPPVIIYTSEELSNEAQMELKKYSQSVVLKGLSSYDRLLDETNLFLHAVKEELNGTVTVMPGRFHSHDTDSFMAGKKVLLVDDDMRNLFALTDELEEFEFEVIKATNGREALDVLEETPGIDIVLMDIMMPIMNGYDAMKEIRRQPGFQNLPVIALTAKAMKEDGELCIKAGANDYISKPVDMDRLISTMRVWMKD